MAKRKSTIGNRYLTRNGKVATMMGYYLCGLEIGKYSKVPRDICYPAICLVDGEELLYTLAGEYTPGFPHDLDLVKLLPPLKKKKK